MLQAILLKGLILLTAISMISSRDFPVGDTAITQAALFTDITTKSVQSDTRLVSEAPKPEFLSQSSTNLQEQRRREAGQFVLKDNHEYGAEAERYAQQGVQQVKERRLNEAINSFTRVIELEKAAAMPYYARAMCYLSLKNFNAAADDLKRAAELYQKQGKPRLAESIAQVAEKVRGGKIPELNQ